MVKMSVYLDDILSMSYEAWPWLTYPNFLVGSCIVLSGSAIAPLLAGFQVTPYIPFDDVYLTGLVTRRVNSSIRVLSSEKYNSINGKFSRQAKYNAFSHHF